MITEFLGVSLVLLLVGGVLGFLAHPRRAPQSRLVTPPEGFPCLCGHQINEHRQEGDMTCVRSGCPCMAFILKGAA